MTDLNNLYETAVQILDKTVSVGMTLEEIETSSVSAILTDSGNIYTGISGNKTENGTSEKTCSEYEAVNAMIEAGENRIIGIVTIAFKNRMIVIPCEKCRELICSVNSKNKTCRIMIKENISESLDMVSSKNSEEYEQMIQSDEDLWGYGKNETVELQISNPDKSENQPYNNSQMNDNNYYGQNPQMMGDNNYYGQNPQMMGDNNYYGQNPQMMGDNNYYGQNPQMMDNGYYQQNPQMMNNGYYQQNPQMMNNGYYQQNPQMMNNGYYHQNNNPYDTVQPVPPSSIYGGNSVNSRYSVPNTTSNMYVNSSNSQYISQPLSQNNSANISENSGNSIYKQKLKDLLKTESTENKSPENETDSLEMKKQAKLDAKVAKDLAKASKKSGKKGFFGRFGQ